MADMVTVQTEGFDRLFGVLRELKRKCADRRPLMRTVVGIMHAEVDENFEQEGRPKWAPLAASTIRQRKAKGHWPGQILKVRGRLVNSMVELFDNDSAIVGTNVAYAKIQQFGGVIKRQGGERVLNFRQAKRGKITFGRPGTGDLFAKASKAHYSMKVSHGPYEIRIPARPPLKLTEGGISKIERAVVNYLSGA